MKRNVTLFSRKNYVTNDAGGVGKIYVHDPELFDILGQAKTIRYHFSGHWRSAAAQVVLRAYESAVPNGRPQETGSQIGGATTINTTGPTFANVTGPFAGRVEVQLEVSDPAAPAGGPQEFDCDLQATLILDE